ncbi:MAG: ABC transporter ATPase [Oscillospiraceae bacterium]|nr:ABC transporter ATPase [Oscillospiraceae bacterium]
MAITTIQKRNKLNIVRRADDPGAGGAYHCYEIVRQSTEEADFRWIAMIQFQHGARGEGGSTEGVLDCDLLEIVRDRLAAFQCGDYACKENEYALRHVEEALLWMNKRVEDRAERGVLGTNKV